MCSEGWEEAALGKVVGGREGYKYQQQNLAVWRSKIFYATGEAEYLEQHIFAGNTELKLVPLSLSLSLSLSLTIDEEQMRLRCENKKI